jgi:periplasmic divalent cation tolerance protein
VGIIEVTTTVDSESVAISLATQIVTCRLAACIQITGPIQSIYRWQGEICQSHEWRCTMKSLECKTSALVEMICNLHPYEVPEILVQSIDGCSDAYRQWLTEQID